MFVNRTFTCDRVWLIDQLDGRVGEEGQHKQVFKIFKYIL